MSIDNDNKGLGASPAAPDRATHASHQAPAGLGHSVGIADADHAAGLSEWTDRPMLVGGFEFAAGQVTVADILDHAAHAYERKQEQRAKIARQHEWNDGNFGRGYQCKHCGTVQWCGIGADDRLTGNYSDECPRRPAQAIEAATAGETGTGSTEGESAVPQGCAQPTDIQP